MKSVLWLLFLWKFRHIQAQSDKPTFRVVAPDFVCAKDRDTVIEKADETVIMLQTRGTSDLEVVWNVRWQHLPSPSQRFTLMVWKAVRELEALLNRTPKQKYVYVIDNKKLLRGIVYTFTVNGRTADGIPAEPKSFKLDNSQGEKELSEVDGRGAKFSVNLLGSEVVYPDAEFVLEAQVTSCVPTEDYHFSWSLRSLSSDDEVDTSFVAGARLVIPANSLKSRSTYDVNCQVIRSSSNETIAQTGLQFEVSSRGSAVYLNADFLIIGKGEAFTIDSLLIDGDVYNATPNFQWSCAFMDKPCEFFESENAESISFASGLLELGNYTFRVSVNIETEMSSAEMNISVIDADLLPVLKMSPTNPVLNEGSQVTLTAAASNVAPSCTFTWYFKGNADDAGIMNESCVECQHGTPMSDSKRVNSLEENFLEELADFTNTTQKVQLEMKMAAASGRIRLVADCGCSLTFSCESQGVVYADVGVVVNEYPVPGGILVSPESGVALETVFRISTESVKHPEVPLKYTFFCSLGTNQSLVLGSYVEFTSVETVLPFVDDTGTEVWVDVCDALGACSTGASSRVNVARGSGRTADALLATLQGNARRCEMLMLQRVAVSAVVTYMNSGLADTLALFSSSLRELLESADLEICRSIYIEEYTMFLQSLADVGFDYCCREGNKKEQ